MIVPALVVLALQASATHEIDLSARAGYGHDANLSHDAEADAAVASDFVLASARAGVTRVTERWLVGAGGVADATRVRDVPDLSEVATGGEVLLGYSPAPRLLFTVVGAAVRSWWRDPARDAWSGTALGALRLRPGDRLSLAASYGHARRDAADDVYDGVSDRVSVRLEARVGRASYLWAGYSWAWLDELYYVPVSGAADPAAKAQALEPVADGGGNGEGPGPGSDRGTWRLRDGRRFTGSFPGGDRMVVSAETATRTARAGVEFGLFGGTHLELEVSYVTADADAYAYDAWSGTAALGWRR